MWYIIKPILMVLLCLIFITYKSIEYLCVLLFRLFFLLKWTKYSSINNNASDLYYKYDGSFQLYEIDKDGEMYEQEKSPIESIRKFYAGLKSI